MPLIEGERNAIPLLVLSDYQQAAHLPRALLPHQIRGDNKVLILLGQVQRLQDQGLQPVQESPLGSAVLPEDESGVNL